MAVPVTPKVPEDRPLPIWAEPVLESATRAAFWARLAGIVTTLTGIAAAGLAYYGKIPWWPVVPLILAPLLPIAAETRINEFAHKLEDQVRDRLMEEAAEAVRKDPRPTPGTPD